MTSTTLTGERADLLETLSKSRAFLLHTVQGLTDEQAGQRTTVSELCLGGLIKHVATVERGWADFIVDGADGMTKHQVDWAGGFKMLEGETLAGHIAFYQEVARRTDELIATVDLDSSHELPRQPWFEPGARWSARRVVAHLIAETAQHSGHADILREAIDGQKTMG